MTQMDTDEKHEGLTGMDRIYRIRKSCITMKIGRVGRPGRPSLCLSPLATSPVTAGCLCG